MFPMRLRGAAWALCAALAAVLLLTSQTRADDPRQREKDLLDEARRRDEVAAQKTAAELHQTMREAQTLAATDSKKAVALLKDALGTLDDDTTLGYSRRRTLKRLIQDRIRLINLAAEEASRTELAKALREGRRAEAEKIAANEEKLKQSLKRVNKLRQEGKNDEADRMADELARQYPRKSAVTASERIGTTTRQIDESRKQLKEKEARTVKALDDVSKSAMLPKDDIEFPKDWKEKSKRRLKKAGPTLTPKEAEIMRVLNASISVAWKNAKLEDVIAELEDRMGITILLDKAALGDVDVSYDSLVSLRLRNVAGRTVLRKILGDVGLTYIIKDEAIQVVSPQTAKESMVTRVYSISDLTTSPLGGTGLGALQTLRSVAQIIDLIEDSIDSQSWRKNGGNGTITYDAASQSLIIKQSAEFHALRGIGSAK